MLGSSDCDWATSRSQNLSSHQMTPAPHQHRPVLSQLNQETEGSTATTIASTSIISTGHEEFPGSSQGTQFQISTPALGVPGSVAQPIQFPPGVQIPVSGFTVGRLPMASQAIPGQVKLDAMTQLQHPGMFPHAYIIPNGHAAQEFVQPQQVIGQQVVGAHGQVPPPPPVEANIPGQLHMQNGQQMVMVDPNAVPGSHGVMPPATVPPISSTANTSSDDIGNATTSTSSDGTAASQVGDQSSAQGKRLHVSNIPFRFRDPDLRTMFGKHGKIADVEIIFNERGSKGFGFITFETREGAECAKKALNGTIIEGRKVEVNDATARVQTKKPALPLINGLRFAPMMPNLIAADPYAAAVARLNPVAANAYRQAALLGGRGRSIYQTTAMRPGTAMAAPAAVQGNGLFPLVYESYPTMALTGAMHAGGQEFSQGQTFWTIPGLTAQGSAGAAYGLTAQGTAGAAYGLAAQGTAGAAYGLAAQGTAGAAYALAAQGTAGAAYSLAAQGTAGAAYALAAQGTAGATYALPQYAATRYITPGTGAVAAQPGSAVAYATMPGQVTMAQAVYTNAAAAYTSTGGAVAYPGSTATAIYADPYQQATLTPTAAALAAAYRGYRFAPY